MTKQVINVGTSENSADGDNLRDAFIKVNHNFTELYNTSGADVQIPVQTGHGGEFLTTNGTSLNWTELTAIGDDTQFVSVNTSTGLVVVQSGFNTSLPVYIKGGNFDTEDGVGGSVIIEAGSGDVGTTGNVEISAQQTTIDSNDNVWTFNDTGVLELPPGGDIVDSDGNSVLGGAGGSGDRLVNGDLEAVLDTSGTLNTPLLLPITFTAVFDPTHKTDDPIVLTAPFWETEVQFQVSPNGTIQTMVDNAPHFTNPGYESGNTFRYTEADHGIPGYVFEITLTDVQFVMVHWTANIQCSVPPEYPSTIKSLGAIKLTANENSLVIGTGGSLNLANGGSITLQDTGGVELVAGPGDDSYSGLTYEYRNWIWVDNTAAYIEASNGYTGGTWSFTSDGKMRLPLGGDIVDNSGNSVLGGSGASVTQSDTAPSDPSAGDLWYDTVGGRMYVYYDSTWVDANPVDGAGISSTNELVNGDYTVTLGSDGNLTLPLESSIQSQVIPEVGTILYNIPNWSSNGPDPKSYVWNDPPQSLIDHVISSNIIGWTFTPDGTQDLYTVVDAVYGGPLLQITFNFFLPQTPCSVRSPDYSVRQTSPVNLVADDKTWSFAEDGYLNLPGGTSAILAEENIVVVQAGNDPGNSNLSLSNLAVNLASEQYINLITDGGTNAWSFGTDGNLTIPAGAIKRGNASLDFSNTGVVSLSPDTTGVVKLDMLATGTVELSASRSIVIDGGNELAGLESAYLDLRQELEYVFTALAYEPGYPWGITLPVSYNTFTELMQLPPDTVTGSGASVLPALSYDTKNAHAEWQERLSRDKVEIHVNSSVWKFNPDGTTVLPNDTTISDDLAGEYSDTFLCLFWGYTGDAGLFSSNPGRGIYNPLIADVTVGWYVSGPLLNGVKKITEIVEQGNGDRAFFVDLTDGSAWADTDVNIPYRFYTPDYELVYNGTRLTVNSNNWNFAQSGNLTIPGDIHEAEGNDLEIAVHNLRTNYGTPGGAVLSLTNYDAVDGQTYTKLEVGAYDIKLSTDFEGIFTGAKRTWTFDRDGKLTMPGNIELAANPIVSFPQNSSLSFNTTISTGPSSSTSTFTIGAYGIALQNGNGNIYSGTYGDTAVRWNLDSANKELTFPNGAAIHYDQNSSDIELFSYTNPIKITSGQTNHWTFGTDGKLTNPGEVVISTNNTHGGTGFTGFLTLTSTQVGVSNPNKFVRLNVDGNLQIVNSAYSNTIFDLSDTGHLIVSGGLTVLGSVPAHSYGAAGDKVGMVAFDGNYIYYCKQDYVDNTTDIWVRTAWTGTNW
jgi:hypothetical protein